MNKNVRHFRSSKKSKRTIYNQRGTCNFNDITRQVWEDFYQRKKIKQKIECLNLIGEHFKDSLYGLGITSDLNVIQAEYSYFFLLFGRVIEKVIYSKGYMIKNESKAFFKYAQMNKAKFNFSPIKKPLPPPIVNVPPITSKHPDLPMNNNQPMMIEREKNISFPIDEELPPLPSPPEISITVPKLSLKDLNELLVNDPKFNVLILWGPKIVDHREEALTNLRAILSKDVIHMLEEISSGKHQWKNYSFVLYGTDYYQIVFTVKDNPRKFNITKVLDNYIMN